MKAIQHFGSFAEAEIAAAAAHVRSQLPYRPLDINTLGPLRYFTDSSHRQAVGMSLTSIPKRTCFRPLNEAQIWNLDRAAENPERAESCVPRDLCSISRPSSENDVSRRYLNSSASAWRQLRRHRGSDRVFRDLLPSTSQVCVPGRAVRSADNQPLAPRAANVRHVRTASGVCEDLAELRSRGRRSSASRGAGPAFVVVWCEISPFLLRQSTTICSACRI